MTYELLSSVPGYNLTRETPFHDITRIRRFDILLPDTHHIIMANDICKREFQKNITHVNHPRQFIAEKYGVSNFSLAHNLCDHWQPIISHGRQSNQGPYAWSTNSDANGAIAYR